MTTLIMVLLIVWTIVISAVTAIMCFTSGFYSSYEEWYDQFFILMLAISALVIPWGLFIWITG